jgi:uncharacterized protein (DUF302 family)
MRYLSKSVTMKFAEAVAATKETLNRQHLAILAEIDLGNVIREYFSVDFCPYLILSTCNLQLAQQAIQAEDEIGSILLCNVVVQQYRDGRVEISAADPTATIGMINDVEVIWIARQLRSLVQKAIDDVKSFPNPRGLVRDCEEVDSQMTLALR